MISSKGLRYNHDQHQQQLNHHQLPKFYSDMIDVSSSVNTPNSQQLPLQLQPLQLPVGTLWQSFSNNTATTPAVGYNEQLYSFVNRSYDETSPVMAATSHRSQQLSIPLPYSLDVDSNGASKAVNSSFLHLPHNHPLPLMNQQPLVMPQPTPLDSRLPSSAKEQTTFRTSRANSTASMPSRFHSRVQSTDSSASDDSVAFTGSKGRNENGSHQKSKRSRLGCLTCRHRKKRCCETKPRCVECARLGLNCTWPAPGTEHKNRSKNNRFGHDEMFHSEFGHIKILRGVVEYKMD